MVLSTVTARGADAPPVAGVSIAATRPATMATTTSATPRFFLPIFMVPPGCQPGLQSRRPVVYRISRRKSRHPRETPPVPLGHVSIGPAYDLGTEEIDAAGAPVRDAAREVTESLRGVLPDDEETR